MKVISVPLSVDAMNRLDFNEVQPGDVEEIELDRSHYVFAFESGLFDALNDRLGIMIDDYEDESIKDIQKLKLGLEIIENTKINIEYAPFFEELERLFKLALEKQTGVFFFF